MASYAPVVAGTGRIALSGVVAVLVLAAVAVAIRMGPGPGTVAVGGDVAGAPSSTSVVLAPDPTTVTAVAPASTEAPATTSATAPAPPADRTAPFRGMGTWVDVFEWAPSYVKAPETAVDLQPSAVDDMAAQGVQVLYIQATRFNNPTGGDIVDPEVLARWLDRARANKIRVVAWYLATLTDPAADLRRLQAVARLPGVDGIGVDIESTAVTDPVERSARLVELSRAVRKALPDRPLSAIVLPPVDTDVVNLKYWPGFPWQQLRGIYDVWQPMGYWTNRTIKSGYRDAERYTRENVERLRAHLGDPKAVVSPIGGIMDKATPADVAGYLKATRATGCVGVSLYTWGTQAPEVHPLLRAARS